MSDSKRTIWVYWELRPKVEVRTGGFPVPRSSSRVMVLVTPTPQPPPHQPGHDRDAGPPILTTVTAR